MADGAFDLEQVAKAVEGINKGFDEFKASNDARLTEIEKKGAADPLIDEKISKIEAHMDTLQKAADEAVLAAKRRERLALDADGKEIDLDAKAAKWVKSATGNRHAELDAKGMDAYRAAMDAYFRKGERAISDAEFKALSVGSDPNGGYVVNPDMSGRMVQFVFETSPLRAYASTQTISTDALEGLYDLDEAAFGWVAETASRPETDTPDLGAWRIPVHEMYANPRATQKLLDDAEINMEEWLSRKVSDKFARAENAAFTNGDGITKPRGFLTYADWTTAGTFENGKIEQFDTGQDGGYLSAPAGGDILITALYGLKAQYRANATWAMNRATTALTRKLKDSDGTYIWSPGIAAGQPATLLGYPVAPFEDMPDPATGSLSVAIADWREAYQIVDRQGIRVLRDPYSAKPYVQFYSVKRTGGAVLNFEAIKLVAFKA
ncbi:MAG: phage major capsid protein [Epibacterium sp.]|nr:phage major capsid protein [Epibacterium sp.]NQX73865.1 phage major capsid protein [Epibacterium sp.]